MFGELSNNERLDRVRRRVLRVGDRGWPKRKRIVEMNDSEGSDTVARATDSARRIFGPNDLWNAQRLLDRRMQDLRYVPEWGRWLFWDGKRWLCDKLGRVVEYAKEVVLHIHEEALAAERAKKLIPPPDAQDPGESCDAE